MASWPWLGETQVHEFSQCTYKPGIEGFVILLKFINGETEVDSTQSAILGAAENKKRP